jgi:type I restriction enzyme, S subunit
MIDIQNDEPWPIPEDWTWKKMGDVSIIIGGGTPKTSIPDYWEGGEISWLTPADLSNYEDIWISSGRRFITQEGLEKSSARMMPKGTVLMSSRAPIGHLAIASNSMSTNQGFKSFVLNSEMDPEYVYFYLLSIKHLIQELGTGTTFTEVSGKVCKSISIPVPPLEIQRTIADKIKQHRLKKLGFTAIIKKISEDSEVLYQSILFQSFKSREEYR